MEFVVDVQGFKKPYNEFVFKELAITALGDDALPSVFLFGPPYHWSSLPAKYKSENLWLTHNYHGISWGSGDIPQDEFAETLRNILHDASKVHVKGLEKQRWLKKYIKNVYNIEDLGCPSLLKLDLTNMLCNNYDKWQSCWKPMCAARNAVALKNWLQHYYNTPVTEFYKEIGTAAAAEEEANSTDSTDVLFDLRDYYNNIE